MGHLMDNEGASAPRGQASPSGTTARARRHAAYAMVVLLAVLAVLVAVTTPWSAATPPASAAAVTRGDFTAAEVARADAYRSALAWPVYLSLALSLLLAGLLGLTRAGAVVMGRIRRSTGGRVLVWALAGVLALTLLPRLAVLPLSAWAESVRRDSGLSTRSWGLWWADVARDHAVSSGVLALAVLVLVALARRWPGWWWAPAACGAAALVVAGSFLYPVVVEPLSNSFTPLPEGRLRTQVLELAAIAGVPVQEVLVADASRRTTALNAYVSGFGATHRVVVYDTLLAEAETEEVLQVVAHELGHASTNDVRDGTLLGAVGAAAGVCALFLVTTSPRLLRRAGGRDAGDPQALGLVLLGIVVLTQLSSPVQLLVSHQVEARADRAALEVTRDPETFITMQRNLALTNLSDLTPSPVLQVFFASHPSAPDRIAGARAWARTHGDAAGVRR